MSKKFIYVDSNGDYTESPGAYEVSDHVAVSSGGADAGKPIVLDGTGKLDASLYDLSDIDHGSISGLGDDDHTQYILVDGSRAFTGNQSLGGNKITNLGNGTAASDAVNKGQLDFAVAGLQDFRKSVLDKDLLTPPGSPATGDRYLIGQPTDTATGAWASHAGEIAEWNGSAWFFETQPDEGTYVFVEDENTAYIFDDNTFASGEWVVYTQATVLPGNGIEISGNTISVDLLTSGGLKFVGPELAVEPADFAGLGLEDDGSDNLAIDFAVPATEMNTSRAVKASDLFNYGANQGAKIIGADASTLTYSTATTVQGVLEDLDSAITTASTPGVLYTVGTGGVVKGDLLFISGANTVRTKSSMSSSAYSPGLAFTSEAAAATVKVVESGALLTGVLTGATPGAKYYWDGTGFTATVPNGSGDYVWLVGQAKNATDLDVHVEFVKKNA
jgi:hypothetical protein